MKHIQALINVQTIPEVFDKLFDSCLTNEEQYLWLKITDGLEKAEKAFNRQFKMIPFSTDLMGYTLGQFCWNKDKTYFKFNNYVMEHNQSLFDDTILHEVAHYIAFIMFGPNEHHGAGWKTICQVIGARPEVCEKRPVKIISAKEQRKWNQTKKV